MTVIAAITRDITMVSSALSIIGSLALVLLLVAYKAINKDDAEHDSESSTKWKPIQREMLFSLSICDLLTSCLYLVPVRSRKMNMYVFL
jgi:hypothetical protein